MKPKNPHATGCCQTPRRTFLADVGMGFTGLALGALLQQDGIARAKETWTPPSGEPHHAPRAKTVIWVFLSGGYSQMETFDPKPALKKYAGAGQDKLDLHGFCEMVFADEQNREAP